MEWLIFTGFTIGLLLFVALSAWWIAHYSELGQAVLEHRYGYTRCPACDEIILKDEHTNNGKVHEWCETIV